MKSVDLLYRRNCINSYGAPTRVPTQTLTPPHPSRTAVPNTLFEVIPLVDSPSLKKLPNLPAKCQKPLEYKIPHDNSAKVDVLDGNSFRCGFVTPPSPRFPYNTVIMLITKLRQVSRLKITSRACPAASSSTKRQTNIRTTPRVGARNQTAAAFHRGIMLWFLCIRVLPPLSIIYVAYSYLIVQNVFRLTTVSRHEST